MDELITWWERPTNQPKVMIAGWSQWADAGSISSGLPAYLVNKLGAHRVAEIAAAKFYLFQVPGMHHFLRPEIVLKDGYRKSLSADLNEFFYTDDPESDRGIVLFAGREPHMNAERYASTFFDVAEALNVQRIVALGGVYGSMPYAKDREISCIYSHPNLKEELADYAVKFSNYEGGATIGSYLVDHAEKRNIEMVVMYAFVPAYDFSHQSAVVPGIRIESDFKAWYDLMRRFNHMFGLTIDLTELEEQSAELLTSMEEQIQELESQMPDFSVREYLEHLTHEFTERPFVPLDDVWREGLEDIFRDMDDDW